VASGATEQAQSLEETTSRLESMSAMTKQSADNAQQASALAQTARNATDGGTAAVGESPVLRRRGQPALAPSPDPYYSRSVVRSPLRIGRPDELDPLGESLSAFGIGLTLVDRQMLVCWANRFIRGMAPELSSGSSHCYSAMWKAEHRCPDCLPLLVFRTGEAQEGARERGRPGFPVEAYRVRAVPVLDAAGDLRWVAESFVRLSGPGAVTDLASGGRRDRERERFGPESPRP